ncbi:MAG: hypothetical protein MJ240_12245 [Kiritimatiellae bacterium]|nr:hypothetical protein [Kiritimatiellia bacterium]
MLNAVCRGYAGNFHKMSVPAFGGRGLLLAGILLSVGTVSGEEYYLTNTDNAYYDGQNKYRSFNAAGWWSSGAAPCAGNNYTVTNVVVGGAMTSFIQLRVPDNPSLTDPVIFRGDKLTIGSPSDFNAQFMGWGTAQTTANRHQKSIYRINDLHCYGANIYCNNTGYITLLGTCTIHKVDNNNHVTAFYGNGHADGQQRGMNLGMKLIADADVVTRLYCGAAENSGNRTSRIYLEGDMSAYLGKLRANYSSTTVIFDSPTMCLGGVEQFVADRLQIYQNAALSIYPHCVQHRNWGVKIHNTTGGGNFFLETDAESGPFDFILPVTAEVSTMSMTVRGPHPVTLKSDMTNFKGSLKVAPEGALILHPDATLPGDMRLEVGDGATLGFSVDGDSEKGPVTLKNAMLGQDVKFVVAVRELAAFVGSRSFSVARIPASYGSFTAADFRDLTPRVGDLPYSSVQVATDGVTGDTLVSVVVSYGASTAVWDGGGSDTALATAANWADDATPDFISGALAATFATGGVSADITGAVAFRGLTFALPAEAASFTLTKGEPDAQLVLGSDGVTTAPRAEGSAGCNFTIEVPVTFTHPQEWPLAAGTAVDFSGGVAVTPAMTRIRAYATDVAEGTTAPVMLPRVGWSGDLSSFTGVFCATNVTVDVAGTNVFGTGDQLVRLTATHKAPLDEARCLLRTHGSGIEVNRPIRAELGAHGVTFLFGEGTSNVFHRQVTTYGATVNGVKVTGCSGRFRSQNGAYTRFEGTASEGSSLYGDAHQPRFDGEGTFEFTRRIYNSSGVYFGNDEPEKKVKILLRASDNYGFSITLHPGSDVHVFADDAFRTRAQDTVDNRTATQVHGILDLHGTTQRIWRVQGGGLVTSETPAVFSPMGVNTNRTEWLGVDQWTMNLVFSNAVDFVMASGRTTLTKVSPSTGELAATNGWIKLTATADWPNARGVRVERDGQLTLAAGGKFGEKTEWRVGGNGRIHIPEGVVQKCGKLYFNDIDAEKPVKPGIYGSAEAQAIYPAAHVDAHLTGKGLLKVVRAGFSISFR